MYFLDGAGVGQYTPWRQRVGLTPQPQKLLRFLSLDNFGINQSTLTADHLSKIRDILVKTIEASWKTLEPIDLIRLVGHTDATGDDEYNLRLGDRRAQAVAMELLKIYPRSGQVRIAVDHSQGERQPTADNRTAEGRARNRRVEVFIMANTRSIPEPPKKPPCLGPKCIKDPGGSVIETTPDPMWNKIPSAPPGKSVREWLIEVCSRAFPPKACPTMVDQALKGACYVLEQIIAGAGATLTEKQKEELRKNCREAAQKPSFR
jgi:outer membrane protein OmpA-like peptidoglycan-associated protein